MVCYWTMLEISVFVLRPNERIISSIHKFYYILRRTLLQVICLLSLCNHLLWEITKNRNRIWTISRLIFDIDSRYSYQYILSGLEMIHDRCINLEYKLQYLTYLSNRRQTLSEGVWGRLKWSIVKRKAQYSSTVHKPFEVLCEKTRGLSVEPLVASGRLQGGLSFLWLRLGVRLEGQSPSWFEQSRCSCRHHQGVAFTPAWSPPPPSSSPAHEDAA